MIKTYYEVQYSVDGKTWLRMGRHLTESRAVELAGSRANEEIETRVAKVTVQVLKGRHFPKVPGKKQPPVVLPGLGVIS